MKIQEKVYCLLDGDGKPVKCADTRAKARELKKAFNGYDRDFGTNYGPYTIVQYKRWKKAS